MAKKVKAPKTYNPGKGRPLEHLAYLNEREMDYLRALNGGYMERGPRGLPSFAEESLAGPGGGKGGGGGGGGSSGGASGSTSNGGQGASPSTASTTSASQPKAFDRSQTMMTLSNGVSYDYDGNVVKSAPSPNKSNSFASPNFPSTVNLDRQVQNQTQIKDAIQAVKNTPAIKSSAAAGGIKAINVGPLGTSVPTAPSKPSPSVAQTKRPDAKIGMSAPRGFYDGITAERESQLRGIQRQEERKSSGLLGTSLNDPRDTVSVPARTDVSERFTPAERQAAWDAVNPAKIAGSIYNDPYGAASRAGSAIASGIGSLGDYLGESYNTIGRLGSSPDPMERAAAAEKAAEVALNYGLMGSAGSMVGGVPKDALGSLAIGRSSADKSIKKMFDAYDDAVRRGATPESAFYESQKFAPSYAGGVVDVVSEIPKSPNSPVKYSQAVEIAEPFEIRSSGLVQDAIESIVGRGPLEGVNRYSDVFKEGPINKSYPTIGDMPVFRDPFEGANIYGYYSPATGLTQGFSSISNPGEKFNALRYGSTALQTPVKQDILSKIKGAEDRFRMTAAHEGTHRVSDMDTRAGVSNPFPQGTSDVTQENLIRDALSRGQIPAMTQKEIQDLAWERYKNNPGEYYARQAESFLDRPVVDMRDYRKRFGNMTLDDLRAMMRYGLSTP